MLLDLLESEGSRRLRADVAVIGAGPAGLVLASRLSREGLRVVVLESGGERQAKTPHPLNEVVLTGHGYRGARDGRARALGGTSTLWGGAMLPMLACDFDQHTAGWDSEWPISIDEAAEGYREVERLFRLPPGPFELACAADETFTLRSAKWPMFPMRNIAHVLRFELADPTGVEVWLNATVVRFALNEAGRLSSVTARSPSGSELKVEAPCFAIAAGAIESTRLLLLLDAQHNDRVFAPDAALGRYFHDHLSASAALVSPPDRGALNAAFGLRFEGGGFRDVRLEPNAAWRREKKLPGGFAIVAAVSRQRDGFAALRAIQGRLQRRSAPAAEDVATLIGDFGWFAKASWWRVAKRRLLAPSRASFELMMTIEQHPNADNRITLSPDRKDAFGSPLAHIQWRVRDRDFDAFRSMQSELIDYWGRRFSHLGAATRTPEGEWRSRLTNGGDIYHPGGSTRMATGPTHGVLDRDLRTFRVDNLYVVSTSAFPSGGTANPTFTLMALAVRAADRIKSEAASRVRTRPAAAPKATADSTTVAHPVLRTLYIPLF